MVYLPPKQGSHIWLNYTSLTLAGLVCRFSVNSVPLGLMQLKSGPRIEPIERAWRASLKFFEYLDCYDPLPCWMLVSTLDSASAQTPFWLETSLSFPTCKMCEQLLLRVLRSPCLEFLFPSFAAAAILRIPRCVSLEGKGGVGISGREKGWRGII